MPLKGQLWTRSERNLKEPDVHPLRRALAAVVAAGEIALLGWLWFGPALAIRSVDTTGAHHLTSSQVAAAAGLNGGGSVLAVDGESDRLRLLNQVWTQDKGLRHFSPWNLAKSVSVEQSSAPCSMARAARCASDVRFPPVPRGRSNSRRTRRWRGPGCTIVAGV